MDTKNRVRFSSTIDVEAKELLKGISSETRINQSRLVDEAIFDLAKKYDYSIDKIIPKKEGGI